MQFSIQNHSSGKKHLIADRYEYSLRRTNKNGSELWQCVRRGCGGSASKFRDALQLKCIHKCVVTDRQVITIEMKKRCITASIPVTRIYEEQLCKAVSQSMNINNMHFDSVKSALYQFRNSYIPKLPSTLSEVYIPPEWQLDNAGNQFLRYVTP
ncbi:unnamed protein product, partial [Didymodactylos carnosus]